MSVVQSMKFTGAESKLNRSWKEALDATINKTLITDYIALLYFTDSHMGVYSRQ